MPYVFLIFHQFLFFRCLVEKLPRNKNTSFSRKVKASQCDQLLKDIGALKASQLQIPKRLKPQTSAVDVSEKCWIFVMMIWHGSLRIRCFVHPLKKKWTNTISKVSWLTFFQGPFWKELICSTVIK